MADESKVRPTAVPHRLLQRAPLAPPAADALTCRVGSCVTPQAAAETATPKYLVYGGKTGWLGQQLVTLLKAKGTEVIVGNARIENREDVARCVRCAARTPPLQHAARCPIAPLVA